jgi:hypothetical protein
MWNTLLLVEAKSSAKYVHDSPCNINDPDIYKEMCAISLKQNKKALYNSGLIEIKVYSFNTK